MSKLRNLLGLYVIAVGAVIIVPSEAQGEAESGGGGLLNCSSYQTEDGWRHDFVSAHALMCMSNPHTPPSNVVPGNCQSGNHVHWPGFCN